MGPPRLPAPEARPQVGQTRGDKATSIVQVRSDRSDKTDRSCPKETCLVFGWPERSRCCATNQGRIWLHNRALSFYVAQHKAQREAIGSNAPQAIHLRNMQPICLWCAGPHHIMWKLCRRFLRAGGTDVVLCLCSAHHGGSGTTVAPGPTIVCIPFCPPRRTGGEARFQVS